MNWKKIGRALLFPPIAVVFLLLPLSIGGMLWAMLSLGENHPLTIAGYALAFYTLCIWCVRIPAMVRYCKAWKSENRLAKRWLSDVRLRVTVTLTGNLLWNGAYAALQLGLAVRHHSAWYYSLAGYYFSLALMRFFLARHTLRYSPGEKMQQELRYYRACGWIFLLMNLALAVMMVYMIAENRSMRHHEVTTITMAAYTFTSLTMAIVNVFKYQKYNSPVFSASKVISLASACVSMLTLENTMLTTFEKEGMAARGKTLLLALSCGAVLALILAMAIHMIYSANRKIRNLEMQNGE